MARKVFEAELLKHAEEMDRQGYPAQIAFLKESYDFFKEAGLSDEEIQQVMALTPENLRLLSK